MNFYEKKKVHIQFFLGIAGAVGCMRYIYYASLIGGRLDREEQINKEREIEKEELQYLESSFGLEENNLLNDTFNMLNTRIDPLEDILNIRPYDCREPKIPHDEFLNEVIINFFYVSSFIDKIQKLYFLKGGK